MTKRTLYMIAGEPSGDALGAALIKGFKEIAPDLVLSGVGGPLMEAEGLHSQFPMSDISVAGFAEVVPKIPTLLRRIKACVTAIETHRPSALLTIDSPDFCLRVANRVKRARPDLKTIHYVAPSVWAWRENRATKMAQSIDHVLALLPFEPPYMQAAGMGCDFVGHPAASTQSPTPQQVAQFRVEHRITGDVPLILALPGSRQMEVRRLTPIFGAALKIVLQRFPKARVLVPTLSHLSQDVRKATQHWPGQPIILETQKDTAFAAADVALAASGTVSLELAAADTPMVIAYDMNWLSRRIIASQLKIDTVTLVNLVSETRAVPEYLGADCQPEAIAKGLMDVLDNTARRAAQQEAARLTMERLGRGGEAPGLRAARAVMRVIDHNNSD